ncbi:DUF2970 domain-containing protein [Catenovulum maritimum]|uniref:DUF2970 domain-containing protein n=1 Tax=Catenovulum maritimum TaxID=1513271 RepID=UPI00065FFF04|nr:DUF2970 domain-containing protein [Catenovulum maritimum]
MKYIDYFKSALLALLGIQSDKNRVKDFNQNKIAGFIAAGIILTLVFVTSLILLVSLITA